MTQTTVAGSIRFATHHERRPDHPELVEGVGQKGNPDFVHNLMKEAIVTRLPRSQYKIYAPLTLQCALWDY